MNRLTVGVRGFWRRWIRPTGRTRSGIPIGTTAKVRIDAFELDARLRVEGHETLHVPAHVVQADRIDRRDAHGAVDPGLHGGNPRLGLVPRLEEPAARLIEGLTFGRHDERPLGPVQELYPQFGLELLHRLAGGRLGDEVLGRAARERAKSHDVAVEPEGLEVDGVIIRVPDTYHPTFWG